LLSERITRVGDRGRKSEKNPSNGLFDIDQDVIAFHSQRNHIDTLVRGELGLSGLHMKGPGVPGADDAISLDPSLPQRTTAMRAPVVEREEISADVRETYGDAFHFSLYYVSRRRSFGQAA
jgi:hypothetical protein